MPSFVRHNNSFMALFRNIKINGQNVQPPGSIDIRSILIPVGDFMTKRIVQYHITYDIPIKGGLTENLFARVLNDDLGLGQDLGGLLFGWNPESHAVGADFTVPSLNKSRISCKTGSISEIANNLLFKSDERQAFKDYHKIKFSSHRLTSHETINECISFIMMPHCDITFFLSPMPQKSQYVFLVMENLNYQNLNWTETLGKRGKRKGEPTGWKGLGGTEGIIEANISTSLSSQLWTELLLNSNRIMHIREIKI